MDFTYTLGTLPKEYTVMSGCHIDQNFKVYREKGRRFNGIMSSSVSKRNLARNVQFRGACLNEQVQLNFKWPGDDFFNRNFINIFSTTIALDVNEKKNNPDEFILNLTATRC